MRLTTRPGHRLDVGLILIACLWLLATPLLLFLALAFGFFVDEAGPADEGAADVFDVATCLFGLGLPLAGMITAVVGRRPVAAGLFAVSTVLFFLLVQQIQWFPLSW
ncbi:hypothetical protein [Nonomuraea zeae]|uniref:hypothetical protein n=1 Tax=Nonomuraea zeae TaxID=1642303 RepID=UPI00147826F3|nr:hypothetical protein [Nonomuraea zeae]